MSPEQLDGSPRAIDRPTDIYSLGILLFRLLTGEFPYRSLAEDRNRSSIIREIRDGLTVVPSSRRVEVDPRVDAVFRRATEREPERRYHSMGSLADDLGELLGIEAAPTVIGIRELGAVASYDPSPTEAFSPDDGQLVLSRIPAGRFEMGSSADGFVDEVPVRRVSVSRDFLLGVYPVTQGQYRRLMGDAARPYFDGNPAAPMENVTWLDAIHFCNALSEVEEVPPYYRIDGERVACVGGPGYRLPTEAEWEYACRAGSAAAYHFGDDPALLPGFAWFQENSRDSVQPVGLWPANAFGLHDMHGNVWEWCWDWYGPYDPADCIDPTGPNRGSARVLRGGSWSDPAPSLRSSARVSWVPNDREMTAWRFGFRVARDPGPGR